LRATVIVHWRSVVLLSSSPTPGKPPERQLDGREGNEGGQSIGKVLKVLGETPVSAYPGENALDHPAARLDDETFRDFWLKKYFMILE
jgi:hypothetical protein